MLGFCLEQMEYLEEKRLRPNSLRNTHKSSPKVVSRAGVNLRFEFHDSHSGLTSKDNIVRTIMEQSKLGSSILSAISGL